MQNLSGNNLGRPDRSKEAPADSTDLDGKKLSEVANDVVAFSEVERESGVIEDLRDGTKAKFAQLADIYDVNSYEDLETKDKLRFFEGAMKVVKGLFDKIYYVYEKENQAFGGQNTQDELFEMVYARIRSYVTQMDSLKLANQSGLLEQGDDAKYFVGRRLALLKDFILSKDFAFYKVRFKQFLDQNKRDKSQK